MTREQKDIALVSLLLAWTSSWTNSWVASHEITMMMVIRSRDSSPFTTAQWCLFNANQKKAFEQIVKFYNEHCVWRGCRKWPFHRYWILIIPWFLNKQTGCIAFPMNIVVVLKKLLNKQLICFRFTMKAVFLEGIPKHWCFLWCCPAQALKQSVELHPMTFLHRGSFVRGLRPIPARVWISFSLSQKNLLNKQSICSRFTIKALFLEGILEHWCFLWCWPAQALKQTA